MPGSNGELAGQVIGDTFRLERLIGKGGMGAVYEASHLESSRRFAVKLMHPLAAASPEALARFRREAEVTSSLGHPHVLQVVAGGTTENGTPYFVMELLEGETLGARIRREGGLPLDEVAVIFGQAASALTAVHARGVVHRDLKPDNIFLCRRPNVSPWIKIVDFGLSKVLHSSLTQAQVMLGSPYYMSPEQASQRAGSVDHRADVYGMGVILYMALAARPPFVADNLPDLVMAIRERAPDPLRSLTLHVPPAVDEAILVALHKRPEDRYPSIEAFHRAFRRALDW